MSSMEEQRLVENALTELRFRFVQAMENKETKEAAAAVRGQSRRKEEQAGAIRWQSESIRITVLGSGTSVGVPMIGCHCAVCHSEDPRDQRLRPSVHIQYGDHGVLIDTTPDFRYQALRSQIERVDAILFTHSHADHVMGLDDVRPFNYRQGGVIPIYGSEETIGAIRRSFRYIFDEGDTRVLAAAPGDARLRRRADRSVRAGVHAHPAATTARARCTVFASATRRI